MGISAKAKSGSDGWGLGFLLVLFPEEGNDDNKYVDKRRRLSWSSFSSSSSSKSTSSRCNGSNLLINRAQSTITLCAFIVFSTLLLFTLCNFEPTSTNSTFPRRWLSEDSKNIKIKPKRSYSSSSSKWVSMVWKRNDDSRKISNPALQGMGTLFRRGTRAMSDLVVAHLDEDTTEDELRLFLRALHRSGLTARSDVVLIFPSAIPSNFTSVIQEENDSFLKLVSLHRGNNNSISLERGFDVTQFVKSVSGKRQEQQPLWGRRIHGNWSEAVGDGREGEFTALTWGSVVSFEATELDPENSLAGFLDHVPMSLRRWATYPMLLGRVRRNFKHLMLVDVKNVVVVGDALSRARTRSAESVYLWTTTTTTTPESAHGSGQRRKNSDKNQFRKQNESKPLNPGAIVGGTRGVRRLSNAVLTEIVRAAIQQKSKIKEKGKGKGKSRNKWKSSVTESAILNQLVENGLLLTNNIEVITGTESIPDPTTFVSRNSGFSRPSTSSDYPLVYRGNNNLVSLHSIIHKEICSFVEDSSVYRDC